MENRGSRIDVFGVPDVLPADRMVDKLLIHFLRPRHGGGEVLEVLYPSHRCPGQARVTFQEPDVAARVLQQSSHMLEVDNQQFPLRVKAADGPEVDLPVQATIHLGVFPDKAEVLRLLGSHGFVTTELRSDRVRVSSSFAMLRAVKAHLEKLLKSQNHQTQNSPYSSSPLLNDHKHSSGAGPKHYTNDSSRQAANRSRFISVVKPSYAPPSSSTALGSPPSSPEYDVAPSPRQDHRPSPRSGSESFLIEADVLHYAQHCRKNDIAVILEGRDIKLDVSPEESGLCNVTVLGRNADIAIEKLQSLVNDLSVTLRTQDVPLADIQHDRQVDVAEQIQRHKDMYDSVLIRQMDDTVRLVGPSAEIYALKQSLLGKHIDQSASVRTGRTYDKGSKRRSTSMPRVKENTESANAIGNPRPAGARGYSPSRYQGDGVEGAEPQRGAGARPKPGGGFRERSFSESRGKVWAEKASARAQEKESKSPPPPGPTKKLLGFPIMSAKEMKLKLKLKKKSET